MVPPVPLTSSKSKFHSGLQASIGLLDIQVAKPSLSQISSHHFMVTRSPNH